MNPVVVEDQVNLGGGSVSWSHQAIEQLQEQQAGLVLALHPADVVGPCVKGAGQIMLFVLAGGEPSAVGLAASSPARSWGSSGCPPRRGRARPREVPDLGRAVGFAA